MSDGWSNRERNLFDRLQAQSEKAGAAKRDAQAAKGEARTLKAALERLRK
jgi:hypothetical protein